MRQLKRSEQVAYFSYTNIYMHIEIYMCTYMCVYVHVTVKVADIIHFVMLLKWQSVICSIYFYFRFNFVHPNNSKNQTIHTPQYKHSCRLFCLFLLVVISYPTHTHSLLKSIATTQAGVRHKCNSFCVLVQLFN